MFRSQAALIVAPGAVGFGLDSTVSGWPASAERLDDGNGRPIVAPTEMSRRAAAGDPTVPSFIVAAAHFTIPMLSLSIHASKRPFTTVAP